MCAIQKMDVTKGNIENYTIIQDWIKEDGVSRCIQCGDHNDCGDFCSYCRRMNRKCQSYPRSITYWKNLREIYEERLTKMRYNKYCKKFEPVNFIWFILAEDMDLLNEFNGAGIA